MKRLKSIAQRVQFYLKNTDQKLWMSTLAAILYSLLIIASMQRSGTYNYLKTQLIALMIGFSAAVLILFIALTTRKMTKATMRKLITAWMKDP